MVNTNTLLPYRKQLEGAILCFIGRMGNKTLLRDAAEYALTNGGKRFRPAICLMVAEALGNERDVMEAALTIEALHCASLVADDMPCMDDDDLRRSKPSVHKVFGEGMAMLVSYALIAEGYRGIARCAERTSTGHVCQLALDSASKNSGLLGATGGQFLDMTLDHPSADEIQEVIQKKTGALFEISFVFGWLFGGGDPDQLPQVELLSQHFGMAFQVMDDIGDLDQDRAQGKQVNYSLEIGIEPALDLVGREIESYLTLLKTLKIHSKPLSEIGLVVLEKANRYAEKNRALTT